MSVIDVEALLADVSEESPCGEDLEYDTEFGEMERAAVGKEEHQIGDEVIEAEPPDWRALKKLSSGLLGRSKDLRAAVHLSRALINTDGYPGLHDGLSVLVGLCESRWPGLHPLLDPDDDNDPTMRVNIIEALANKAATLDYLRAAPLVESRVLGRFGLRELAYASGELSLPEGFRGDPPTTAMIDGAFMECELDDLTATADAVNGAVELVDRLDKIMADVMEVTSTPDISELRSALVAAQAALREPLERRGVAAAGGDEEAAAGGGQAQQQLTGEITSREDVVRALDKICDFYRRQEPSSPVPVLLRRAKRLVPKDFVEIVEDLAPSGLGEVRVFAGPEDEET